MHNLCLELAKACFNPPLIGGVLKGWLLLDTNEYKKHPQDIRPYTHAYLGSRIPTERAVCVNGVIAPLGTLLPPLGNLGEWPPPSPWQARPGACSRPTDFGLCELRHLQGREDIER